MASVAGMIGRGCGSSSWIQLKNSKKKKAMRKNDRVRVCTASYSASSAVTDPYKTLRIQPGASESEVKKAFRQLALQIVMSNLRGESTLPEMEMYESYDADEPMRGMNDPDWDMWEEWMGWEGAGIRDYSSHINPYI
ncbi:hypothetical protein CsSME_00052703 [Camellia sinensis var. sinensis]